MPGSSYPCYLSARTRQRLRLESASEELYGRFSSSPSRSRLHKLSMTGPDDSKFIKRATSMPSVFARNRGIVRNAKYFVPGVEYYRLRNFWVTSKGVYNLGDTYKPLKLGDTGSFRTVYSAPRSTQSTPVMRRIYKYNAASELAISIVEDEFPVPSYVVAVMGAPGVGKSSLTFQLTTSKSTSAFGITNEEEIEQQVRVMLNDEEADLLIMDHCTMDEIRNLENLDVCLVVYSVEDRSSIVEAEKILMELWENDIMPSVSVILVGNKMDLERVRQISTSDGRQLANECKCKFIETSSGWDHNSEELLVGIIAQIKLNMDRRDAQRTVQRKRLIERGKSLLKSMFSLRRKSKPCENFFTL